MNHNFSGRKEEQLKIYEGLNGTEVDTSHRRIMVLCGLGGIGKSQLAAQYAYDCENTYSSVWWVNAKTTTSLSQDFFIIAQKLVSHHAGVRTSIGQNPDYSWLAAMLRLPVNAIDQSGKLAASTDMESIIQAVKSWFSNKDNHD